VSRAFDVLRDPDRRRSYDAAVRGPSTAAGTRSDWFADEVAVDFPSVASVLDRMRHAFFGAEPIQALAADVVLSPEEAFWGTVLDLQVPLRRICRSCGGRGEIWSDDCSACGGFGDVPGNHGVRLRVPAGVKQGTRFRFSVSPRGSSPTLVEVRIAIR
jgi:DnaJ-class molecular chaperone